MKKSLKNSKNMTKFLIVLGFVLTPFMVVVNAESISQLANETRVIDTASELHITGTDSLFDNATVSLNHEDAWLFFDNIRPSEVSANYLGNVKINGADYVERVNGRIAKYAHGTVVMPHASTFKPLTVFDTENFEGDSARYSQHTYYKELGDMDNAIQSFKLKRGYMATFANNADGTGYSRVFIADESDLEFAVMPEALHGTASFIRVLRYDWVTKKGWCGGSSEADLTESTWYYNWQANLATTENLEFVPMRAKLNWSPFSQINALQNVSHSLGLNEPDHSEQHKDDNGEQVVTVAQALEQWPYMLQSGLRVGAPATTDFSWLYDFIDQCNELNYRVDYVAVHAYWGSSAQAYYNSLKYVHERTGLPIWITEWNYGANWTSEWWPEDPSAYTDANADHALYHIKEIVEMFDTAHFIERYSIYNWVEDGRAVVLDGALTKAGEFYANNNSVIAFDKRNEVVLGWNYTEPTISYRYLSLSNSINIAWDDENGEMSRLYELEKKVADGEYETIYTSNDRSVTSFSDELDANLSGRITYRLNIKTIYGDFISSNEVSYFQSAGVDTVQVANLNGVGSAWQSCLFSHEYDETPAVLLGVPSFNNLQALTMRVNNLSTKNFKFTLSPWAYLGDVELSNTDDISILSLPYGHYDFGQIKGEVALLEGVTRDWVSVTFSQAYDTVPVILATQVSNSNTYPTAIAVRNVTTTGFEICVQTEESITQFIYGEKVNFLAVEPGQGVVEGKRFTVGRSLPGEGLKSTLTIDYLEDYSSPIFFAGLQSAENTFACNLRYQAGDNSIDVLKQREMSGSLSSIKKDDLGWLIMDISAEQEYSSIPNHDVVDFVIYPNPVVNQFSFDTTVPKLVQVFNLSGKQLLSTVSSGTVDISDLPSGIYLCAIDGGRVQKVIKQ